MTKYAIKYNARTGQPLTRTHKPKLMSEIRKLPIEQQENYVPIDDEWAEELLKIL